MSERPWTVRRVAGGLARRVPMRPLRWLFPYPVWRALTRAWLAAIRADPNRETALRRLLEVHDDVFWAMDRGAIEYEGGVHPKHRLTGYHDFFVERIAAGERVLDVGCGKGELAYDVAERTGATVVGIDRADWALAFARSRFAHPRVSYVKADAESYEPDAPFDVAILSNVLEHVEPRVELLRALREHVTRALLVRVPTSERDWVVPLRRELGMTWFSDPEHELEYTPELLRAELRDGGWEMGDPRVVWGEIWVDATPSSE